MIHSIDVGRLFAGRTECEFLVSLEVSWTVADRWLILGSNAGVVREIVLARRGKGPALPAGGVHEAVRQVQMSGGSAQVLLLAQPSAASAMVDSWIAYLSRHHPEMLEPDWWQRLRRRQRASTTIQLGILPARVAGGAIEIDQTLPGWPAHGILQPGDLILGIDDHRLNKKQTLRSLREQIAMRERDDRITLRIAREGKEQDVEIPMPVATSPVERIQPVGLLRQLADLLRPFSSASYASWQPAPDLLNARLELRFAAPPAPR